MWESVLIEATKNGLWALLFVALLVVVLKENKKRESNYQETVEKLTNRLNVVDDIKQSVDKLIEFLKTGKRNEEKSSKNKEKIKISVDERKEINSKIVTAKKCNESTKKIEESI